MSTHSNFTLKRAGLVLLLLLLAAPAMAAVQESVSSDITSDTTWYAGGRCSTDTNTACETVADCPILQTCEPLEYVLEDIIFVRDGATLTIEPGAVIRGEPATTGTFCRVSDISCNDDSDCSSPTQCSLTGDPCTNSCSGNPAITCNNDGDCEAAGAGDCDIDTGGDCGANEFCDADLCEAETDPGALVVTADAKIQALGTYLKPIVFTDLNDDNLFANSEPAEAGSYDHRFDALAVEGQWGGVILLGNGYVSSGTLNGPDPAVSAQIEGLERAGLCSLTTSQECTQNSQCPGGEFCNTFLGLYGDCDGSPLALDACDDDSSGDMEYVSIRYGGFNLAPANEINGLTLGGVGRGTDLDYIEVFQNQDDGIEFFGGAANVKHLIIANVGDDGIDYDQGWRGKIQFGLVLQGAPGNEKSDKGGEHDGGTSPDGSQPYAIPTLYNITSIGLGGNGTSASNFSSPVESYPSQAKNTALIFRDNAGGRYYNSLFADYAGATVLVEGASSGGSSTGPNTSGERTTVDYLTGTGNCSITTTTTCDEDGDCPGGEVCVYHYVEEGGGKQLEMRNNTWYCIGSGGTIPTGAAATSAGGSSSKEHHDPGWLTGPGFSNSYVDCTALTAPIRNMSRLTTVAGLNIPLPIDKLDPRRGAGELTSTRTPPADGFFDAVTYQGAFDTDHNWAMGWSNMSNQGYFPGRGTCSITAQVACRDSSDCPALPFPAPAQTCEGVVSVSADITGPTTWTKENEYILEDIIFVRDGATLTIEPGTVVRGEPATTGLFCRVGSNSCNDDGDCTLPTQCSLTGDTCTNSCSISGAPCNNDGDCGDTGGDCDLDTGGDCGANEFCDADLCEAETDPGALVVTADAKIDARGTWYKPIVFTNLDDDNIGHSRGTGIYGNRFDALASEGTWGGVILLGNGYVSSGTLSGPDPAVSAQIEGLERAGLCSVTTSQECTQNSQCPGAEFCNTFLGLYGDCDGSPLALDACDDDSSGDMEYVSIRYGGFNLAPANEINGLTLGGVGRGTDLDYIEVFQNQDDGIEFFGGAANVKHLIIANVGDDGIDYDQGWRGKVQFGLVMQGAPGNEKSDKGGEHDGGTSPDGSQPYAIPTLYNITSIGLGGNGTSASNFTSPSESYPSKAKNTTVIFRDNAGGRYYNSLFADYAGAAALVEGASSGGSSTGPNTSGERTTVDYDPDTGNCSVTTTQACGTGIGGCPGGEVCVLHYVEENSEKQLEMRNNTWYCIGNGGTVPTGATAHSAGGSSSKEHHDPGWFTNPAFGNTYVPCSSATAPIRSLERLTTVAGLNIPLPIKSVDPRRSAGALTTTRQPSSDGFFEPANYQGAFGTQNWALKWSNVSRLGYFPFCGGEANPTGPAPDEVTGLRLIDKDTMVWDPIVLQGLMGVQFYDVLRSEEKPFANSVLVEDDDLDETATDTTDPATAQDDIFFYLVRGENPCGAGTLGVQSNNVERTP